LSSSEIQHRRDELPFFMSSEAYALVLASNSGQFSIATEKADHGRAILCWCPAGATVRRSMLHLTRSERGRSRAGETAVERMQAIAASRVAPSPPRQTLYTNRLNEVSWRKIE
jgi:hypothetical protein